VAAMQFYEAYGAAAYLGPLAVLGIGIYFIFIRPKMEDRERFKNSPKEGPMKIDVRTEHLGKGKYRMYLDAVMSQRDQTALENSGLKDHALFFYPHPNYPDIPEPYEGRALFHIRHVDFPDIQSLNKAKDDLMKNLHAMRSQLDRTHTHQHEQKIGATSEKFEI
jgi:hypothetical protein